MRKSDVYLIVSLAVLNFAAFYTIVQSNNFNKSNSIQEYVEGCIEGANMAELGVDGEGAESYVLTYCQERANDYFKHKEQK
jgi:hypothetical protein